MNINQRIASLVSKAVDEAIKSVMPSLINRLEKSNKLLLQRIKDLEEREQVLRGRWAEKADVESVKVEFKEAISMKAVESAEWASRLQFLQSKLDALPAPRDGRDGRDGKDGSFTHPSHWQSDKTYGHSSVVIHRGGVFFASRETDQEPLSENSGWVLIVDGVKGMDFAWDTDSDVRRFLFYVEHTSGEMEQFEFRAPFPVYRGCYDKDEEYEQQDFVTRNGSLWIALKDKPANPPGTDEGAAEWKLAVKAGKNGKAGRPGKDGEPGKDGKPGKDGQPGKDGVGIAGVQVNAEGHLEVKMADGSEIDAGELPQGPRGVQGSSVKGVSFNKEKKRIEFEFEDRPADFIELSSVLQGMKQAINWRGKYIPGNEYEAGDVVRCGAGRVVICLQDTKSTPPTNLDEFEQNLDWDVFAWLETSS